MKKKTDPPDHLPLTEKMIEWAIDHRLNDIDLINEETEAMLDHFRGHGKQMADWEATWRNWMRNVKKYRGYQHVERPEETIRRTNEAIIRRALQNGTLVQAQPDGSTEDCLFKLL